MGQMNCAIEKRDYESIRILLEKKGVSNYTDYIIQALNLEFPLEIIDILLGYNRELSQELINDIITYERQDKLFLIKSLYDQNPEHHCLISEEICKECNLDTISSIIHLVEIDINIIFRAAIHLERVDVINYIFNTDNVDKINLDINSVFITDFLRNETIAEFLLDFCDKTEQKYCQVGSLLEEACRISDENVVKKILDMFRKDFSERELIVAAENALKNKNNNVVFLFEPQYINLYSACMRNRIDVLEKYNDNKKLKYNDVVQMIYNGAEKSLEYYIKKGLKLHIKAIDLIKKSSNESLLTVLEKYLKGELVTEELLDPKLTIIVTPNFPKSNSELIKEENDNIISILEDYATI